MQNKTKAIFELIPGINFKKVNRERDPFIVKAITILYKMESTFKNVIHKEIHGLSDGCRNDIHRNIITILNDRMMELGSTKKEKVVDDFIATVTSPEPITQPQMRQDFMTTTKTSYDLSLLENTLLEISVLQSTLGKHLQEQSERISVLNVDADMTVQNLDLGNLELQKALLEMSKSRSWFIYTLVVLSSLLLALDWFYD